MGARDTATQVLGSEAVTVITIDLQLYDITMKLSTAWTATCQLSLYLRRAVVPVISELEEQKCGETQGSRITHYDANVRVMEKGF